MQTRYTSLSQLVAVFNSNSSVSHTPTTHLWSDANDLSQRFKSEIRWYSNLLVQFVVTNLREYQFI